MHAHLRCCFPAAAIEELGVLSNRPIIPSTEKNGSAFPPRGFQSCAPALGSRVRFVLGPQILGSLATSGAPSSVPNCHCHCYPALSLFFSFCTIILASATSHNNTSSYCVRFRLLHRLASHIAKGQCHRPASARMLPTLTAMETAAATHGARGAPAPAPACRRRGGKAPRAVRWTMS